MRKGLCCLGLVRLGGAGNAAGKPRLASDDFGGARACRFVGRACAGREIASLFLRRAAHSKMAVGVATGRHCVAPACGFALPSHCGSGCLWPCGVRRRVPARATALSRCVPDPGGTDPAALDPSFRGIRHSDHLRDGDGRCAGPRPCRLLSSQFPAETAIVASNWL